MQRHKPRLVAIFVPDSCLLAGEDFRCSENLGCNANGSQWLPGFHRILRDPLGIRVLPEVCRSRPTDEANTVIISNIYLSERELRIFLAAKLPGTLPNLRT